MAWRRAGLELICDRIEPWEHGIVARSSRFAGYYDYNVVRVEGPDPGISAAELMQAGDRLLSDAAHRRFDVDDPSAGERLQPDLSAAGFRSFRLAALRWAAPAPREALPVDEVAPSEVADLRLEWAISDDLHQSAEAAQAFLSIEAEAMASRGGRWLAHRGPDGRAIAFIVLLEHDGQAEIALAYCTPRHRGGGVGTSLLLSGVSAASGAGAIWILAADGGRPKQLYERLGFETAAVMHEFTRSPL